MSLRTRARIAGLSGGLAAVADAMDGASLMVMRKLEHTVDALNAVSKLLSGLGGVASGLTALLEAPLGSADTLLDPTHETGEKLRAACRRFEAQLPNLQRYRSAIDGVVRGPSHHEVLRTAHDEAIRAMSESVEATKTLRGALIKRDLAAENRERLREFGAAPELIASLRWN